MNKLLLTTALLAATAGAASAEITLSGSGRFGLTYDDSRAVETQLAYRLRVNVNAAFEADNGVTYGGRIRFQDAGSTGEAYFSPAMLYVEASGVRVEVGNANTAIDSVALMYNPEIGFTESSYGDPQGSFYSFSSGSYEFDRVGIYAAYSVSGVNLKASYIKSDQQLSDSVDESSIAADYTFGQVTLAAAYADQGAGIEGNYITFVGAAYKFSDAGSVGLNYNDNGLSALGKTTTIYGNYTVNGITFAGYVSDSDTDGADTAYGLGAAYDLGGATLAGAIHQGFAGETTGDLGVRMSF